MDNRSVFVFYSGSADKKAGKGTGEYLAAGDEDEYEKLDKIPHWRKMLSNFCIHDPPLEIDGMEWATVEHYYQGSKFKKDNPEFYRLFSLDSGSDLSKDPVMAKGAGGKSGKSKGKQIRPTNIKADKDFFKGRGECDIGGTAITNGSEYMHLAQDVKYAIPEFANMLKLTGDADLQHYLGRGSGLIRFEHVMKIRDSL